MVIAGLSAASSMAPAGPRIAPRQSR